MSSREGRRWAGYGRGALVSPCVAAAWRRLLLRPLSVTVRIPRLSRLSRPAALEQNGIRP
ncbi:hypothetical protein [Streptomyces sp. NBC_01538]|uniref:hypothetical protein n=1 Tax=Streptomyces sp. NBC_01538 TaxID=2903897 RepID=UPI0038686018